MPQNADKWPGLQCFGPVGGPKCAEVALIRLTRLNSQPITVISDLIKFVESNPDTVITLVNGDKILVHETAAEVVERVIAFRRSVIGGLLSVAGPGVVAIVASGAQPDCSTQPHTEGRSGG